MRGVLPADHAHNHKTTDLMSEAAFDVGQHLGIDVIDRC